MSVPACLTGFLAAASDDPDVHETSVTLATAKMTVVIRVIKHADTVSVAPSCKKQEGSARANKAASAKPAEEEADSYW